MKARLSPLEIQSYLVTDIRCSANPEFDPAKETTLSFADLHVESVAHAPKSADNDDDSRWFVELTTKQDAIPDKNAPYSFQIVLQGWFRVAATSLSDANAHQLVETTGGSILYGAAREILRSTMSAGPFLPMLLPSISFHPNAPMLVTEAKSLDIRPKSTVKKSSPSRKNRASSASN